MFGKIQVVVYKQLEPDMFPYVGDRIRSNLSLPVSSGKDWIATVVSNPKLRAIGENEEQALEALRIIILSAVGLLRLNNVSDISFKELSFEDLMVKTVMDL